MEDWSISSEVSNGGVTRAEVCSIEAIGSVVLYRYWTGARVFKRTWPYDMWSLGVSWLELVLGTPHVFQARP